MTRTQGYDTYPWEMTRTQKNDTYPENDMYPNYFNILNYRYKNYSSEDVYSSEKSLSES